MPLLILDSSRKILGARSVAALLHTSCSTSNVGGVKWERQNAPSATPLLPSLNSTRHGCSWRVSKHILMQPLHGRLPILRPCRRHRGLKRSPFPSGHRRKIAPPHGLRNSRTAGSQPRPSSMSTCNGGTPARTRARSLRCKSSMDRTPCSNKTGAKSCSPLDLNSAHRAEAISNPSSRNKSRLKSLLKRCVGTDCNAANRMQRKRTLNRQSPSRASCTPTEARSSPTWRHHHRGR